MYNTATQSDIWIECVRATLSDFSPWAKAKVLPIHQVIHVFNEIQRFRFPLFNGVAKWILWISQTGVALLHCSVNPIAFIRFFISSALIHLILIFYVSFSEALVNYSAKFILYCLHHMASQAFLFIITQGLSISFFQWTVSKKFQLVSILWCLYAILSNSAYYICF